MTYPLRILLIEDSPADARLVMHTLGQLSRPTEFERVEDAQGLRAACEKGSWHLIISDWSMPRFSGLDALAIVRGERHLDTPFIIVSGTVGEDAAVQAMRAGANDYVIKDKLSRLVPAAEREMREHTERDARRLVEQKFKLQEARFRALVEKGRDGICMTAADGMTIYVSPVAKRLLELTDDVIGENLFQSIHMRQADHTRINAAFGHLAVTPNDTFTIEFRVTQADQSVVSVECQATNLLHDLGLESIVVNFTDVTEQRRALEDLHASEVRFSRLYESGIVGIVECDVHGRVFDANASFLAMVGYSREDAVFGKIQWPDLTPEELRATNQTAMQQLPVQGVAPVWETEVLCKDGSRIPTLLGIAVLEYPKCIAFYADLSERKRAERALQQAQNQFLHAQKMEAVGRLAGGVAHDFNNLLSVILSYSSLLQQDLNDPQSPMHADLREIQQAGQRGATLTRQLLTFSRQQVAERSSVDFNTILVEMDKMLRRLLGEDVELITRPGFKLEKVMMNAGHIEQVLMNLAVNSRDAMPKGGKLSITTQNVVLNEADAATHMGVQVGPHVLITIADTGVGMDKATQTRIFEPFFTTKEKGKGTGLGLSTVFGIVQQSGGNIWVESEPGQGTTFTILLPVSHAQPVADAPAAPEAVHTHGRETILLVEDEDQVRAVAHGILLRHGYQVIVGRNPVEALQLSASYEGTIHLLLTDVVMPHMSGPELAHKLSQERPDMRILCMSGYTDDQVVQHGVLDLGGMAFLQKPITPETLGRRVREVLG